MDFGSLGLAVSSSVVTGDSDSQTRTIGLGAATGVGVGAIVGGGILVLAGVAFATTGPGAMVAFGVNGVIALLTALSFAEISTSFPESGGAYTFAKKVLSVRAAFGVGWILWFAYIVAGVLYALGFAAFTVMAVQSIWMEFGHAPPTWIAGRNPGLLLATGATVVYAIQLIRQSSGGGQWATVGKVVVFVFLILAGLVAFVRQPLGDSGEALTPFFSGGASGLVMAMGFTFIALQGFDLIAAVAGEIKEPSRTIPRAMFASLGIALAIYLPLLLLVSTVGVEPGGHIEAMATASPEMVVPLAARQFLGAAGYWLVIVAAILSTLSALQANLLAASRVALSMARDRTLPAVLGDLHKSRRTPVMAIYTSALTLVAIAFMVPDLAAAGAAASLIFLVSFTLTHVTTVLSRKRGGADGGGFRMPWYPWPAVIGGAACASLGVFQAVVVPDAGGVAAIWLGLGVILYWSLFARRAEIGDATAQALDPSLARLRGRNPLVLMPIANPAHAPAMAGVANALAPRRFGRVLLLTIVPVPDDFAGGDELPAQFEDAQEVVKQALTLSYTGGNAPEALITAASSPLAEIRRVAEEHKCESLLIGLGDVSPDAGSPQLEALVNDVDCDVAVMHSRPGWRLDGARRILVPVGGRGDQHELRARLLGSICRGGDREVVFVTVLRSSATDAEVAEAHKDIGRLADLKVRGASNVQVLRSDDPAEALIAAADGCDLVVLGLRTVGMGRTVFGQIALRIAHDAPCATIMLRRRRARAYEWIDQMRDVVEPLENIVRFPVGRRE